MRRRSRSRRGFTLLEMMLAVVIGAISVVMAAQIAQLVIRQNAKGKQRTDFSARSRLLGRQIRSDLKIAGVGSSGAVAVDITSAPLGQLAIASASGFNAIPVIAGVNNVPANVGAINMRSGSDVIQIIVPNPSLMVRTNGSAPLNQPVLNFAAPNDASILAGCPMIFISDHSSPNGAGRSQIAFLQGANATSATIDGQLQFTVAPESDVMCARISTYWIDSANVLHRSDIQPNGALVIVPGSVPVAIDTSAPNDVVAPGMLDMQIAYRVSGEVYRFVNQNPPLGDVNQQWAYINPALGLNASNYLNTATNWFEIRMVRVSLLGRTMRRVEHHLDDHDYGRLEDAAGLPPLRVRWTHTAEWITATETLTNLRYFDLGTPVRVPPEPY